ncbi:MAG: 50S ribosomal protein L11 methyltransferase [Solirubrobacteraceae bacterium]|jgi:ribosomal protein L11 methyltransferase
MLRLAVRVARAQAELVLAELLELAPAGVEEIDDGDAIEYAIYGAPGELPSLPDLRAAARDALVEVTTREIDDGWSARWREFHKPLVLDHRLTVRPPWEPATGTPIDVVIDPGEAFGTGAHASTRLCLELLLALARAGRGGPERVGQGGGGPAPAGAAGGAFVDLGCGSGVLAVTAAKLGFAPVCAFDNDPASVCAAQANAAVNGVAVRVARLDLRREPVAPAPTIAANLLAPLLLAWAPLVPSECSRVIASGLLVHEADGVATAFAAHGLREVDRRARGEWAALLLAR